MNAVQRARASMPAEQDVLVAAALAVLASLSYVLIEVGILGVASVEKSAMGYAAAGGYLLGGLLILLRWRWLWIAGAVINALVILFFFIQPVPKPVGRTKGRRYGLDGDATIALTTHCFPCRKETSLRECRTVCDCHRVLHPTRHRPPGVGGTREQRSYHL